MLCYLQHMQPLRVEQFELGDPRIREFVALPWRLYHGDPNWTPPLNADLLGNKLLGTVPLSKLVLATTDTPLMSLAAQPLISCHADAKETEVSELFDKYNLITLALLSRRRSPFSAFRVSTIRGVSEQTRL